MKNKKQFIFLCIFLSFTTMSTTAFAATRISYWYSNKDYVAYTPYDGSYYPYSYSSNDSFNQYFQSALGNAASEWGSVLECGSFEASYSYAINLIYGGTYSQLLGKFPDLTRDAAGLTYADLSNNTPKSVTYNGETKEVYKLTAASKMAIVEYSEGTKTSYKNTALHEMGHLYGWKGHSSNSNDVMYAYQNTVTKLTSRDKNHLKQIYDKFY